MRKIWWIVLVGLAVPGSAQSAHQRRLPPNRHAALAAKSLTAGLVPVIVIVAGDALVEFHRHNTSPLLIDHRPFRMEEMLADRDALAHRAALREMRAEVRATLERAGFAPSGETDVVMHTLLGWMPGDRIAEAARMAGVVAIHRAHIFHKTLDGAIPLINALAGWQLLGGESSAGRGMKIGMIDTGIDINHPMLQDYLLTPPAGFPKGESLYTNNKVIVARNYIALLGDPRDPSNAQDRDGHGTFTSAMAVGRRVLAPFASLAGVAPGAFAGNYKVFSSPEFSGFGGVTTNDAALIAAINDAVADGMNVISMSLGGLPLDQPSVSPLGIAITAADKAGLLVVCAAGNDGPDPGTISEPSNSPEAISVGASRNARILANLLTINGPGAPPAALKQVLAVPSDAPAPAGPLRATLWPLIGSPCNPYTASEKSQNAIVLTEDDFCDYGTMSVNASAAGAKALVIYRFDDYDPTQITGLIYTTLPVFEISSNDGALLAAYSKTNRNTLDTSIATATTSNTIQADVIAAFSSEGPDGVTMQLKPELVAPGTSIYSAAEINTAGGDLFALSQFAIADGTSFSAPLVAGTALLVRQLHPDWTPGQVKSAIVNRAANVTTENGVPADLIATGAGRLDVLAALQSTAALAPQTLSFSAELVTAPATFTRTFTITNLGAAAESFNVALKPQTQSANALFAISPTSTAVLNPRESAIVTLTLTAKPLTLTSSAISDGRVTITGATSNRSYTIPYWSEIIDNTVPAGFFILRGDLQTQTVSTALPQPLTIEVVDNSGLIGMAGVPVTFSVVDGGGKLSATKATTDFAGFAATSWTLGPTPGLQRVRAIAAGQTSDFFATAIANPAFTRAGLVNAASGTTDVAPGAIASLYGTGLSVTTGGTSSIPLPVSLNGGQILFGNTASPFYYASPNQINLQIPFELSASSTQQMRATVFGTPSSPVTVQLVAAAPGLFASVLHADNSPVTAASPAQSGEVVTVFGSGFGAVDQQVVSGTASPVTPLANTKTLATARIGGANAIVQFSGLTPGAVGLYQANVVIPVGTTTGNAPVLLSIGGVVSNQITVPVK